MDKEKVYGKIRDIARELQDAGETYTRADLAYELADCGVEGDGPEVGSLVWEAYNHYGGDKAMETVFVGNDGREPIVFESYLDSLIGEGDVDALQPLLKQKLDNARELIDQLDSAVDMLFEGRIDPAALRSLASAVVGTSGVEAVQAEASTLFEGYSHMVGAYDEARHGVKTVMADFVALRSQVCDIYLRFSTLLIDVFGDRIRAVSPQLFDFDFVEWLDVHGMLEQVRLDYDRIATKCQALMGDIQDSFAKSLEASGSLYRQAGGKQAGLIVAGLGMLTHYMAAGTRTNELRQDLVVLKNSVARDAAQIKGDNGRLAVVYKTLNDLYVPTAESFCRMSHNVLQGEWEGIEAALYATPAAQELKQERDRVLADYREAERVMTDAQLNIDVYTARIEANKQLLASLEGQYEQAKESKPKKPLMAFGPAGKRYNRDLYEWNSVCRPVISRYEDLQTDVKLDSDELQAMHDLLRQGSERHAALKEELGRLNARMMEALHASPEVQQAVMPHVEDMVKLLRTARQIAESKLDAQLMRTVRIDAVDVALPADVQQGLGNLSATLRQAASASAGSMRRAVRSAMDDAGGYLPEGDGVESADGEAPGRGAELAGMADAATDAAVEQAVSLVESWAELESMRQRGCMAAKAYGRQLDKLRREFRQRMAAIDDKSAVLREAMRHINTAADDEELKRGLLSLADGDASVFGDGGWEEFIKGNKTVEL